MAYGVLRGINDIRQQDWHPLDGCLRTRLREEGYGGLLVCAITGRDTVR